MLDAKGIKALNNSEGLYYDPSPPTPETPETPTEPLKNGIVNMPDGSIRTYYNGLVVYVEYAPGKIAQKGPKEINEEEGVRNATYTGRETTETPTTPVTPTAPLQQGFVKMPDGSKRMYIDGKVVSVAYPDGVTGPTINEINAAEGTKTAEPKIENPMDAVNDFFKGKTPKEPVAPVTPAPTPTPAPAPEDDVILGNRLDSLMGRPTAPTTQPTQTTTTPTTTTPSGGGPSDYRPRQQEPMPVTTTTTPSGGGPSDYRPRQAEPMQINNP
jgi:hypothetical protein